MHIRSTELSEHPIGGVCSSNNGCLSGNCLNGICCDLYHKCCDEHDHCADDEKCDFGKFYCVNKPQVTPQPEAPAPTPALTPPPIVDNCLGIEDSEKMIICYTEAGYGAADISYCQGIQSPDGKNICLVGFVNRTGDASLCETGIDNNAINPTYAHDMCFQAAAITNIDPTYCGRIGFELQKDLCYLSIAPMKGDVTICSNISGALNKDFCIKNVALEKNDDSLCDMIAGDTKDLCYRGLAVSKKDATLCDKTSHDGEKSMCIVEYVKATGDTAFCYSVEPGYYRDECLGDELVPTMIPTPIPTIEPTPIPTLEPTPLPTEIPAEDYILTLDLGEIEISGTQAFDNGAVYFSFLYNKLEDNIAITGVSLCAGDESCSVSEASGCHSYVMRDRLRL